MENKEQNIGMKSDQDYPISIREFMWEEFCKKFPNQETTNLSFFQVFKLGFRSGTLWQSSQPINSGWVSVEDRLPDIGKYVLVVIDKGNITTWYVGNTEHWINSDYPVTHWMPLPEAPPKQ
jgi:hypothetical protein